MPHPEGARMSSPSIRLAPAAPDELPEFARRLQAAFAVAVVAETGKPLTEPIPSDADIWQSFEEPTAEVLQVLADGQKVGGVVVSIHPDTRHSSLDFLFIDAAFAGRGLGRDTWTAIEQRYPRTLVWETMTPHFETRNIHFYVNVCGFQIVEFFHPGHPDQHAPTGGVTNGPGEDLMFRFEKRMPES